MELVGSSLYVGGDFANAAGLTKADHIARWSNGDWSALGSNAAGTNGALNNTVLALASYGGDLYAGGTFTNAGGVAAADLIARWDGEAWTAVGGGLASITDFMRTVRALAVFEGDLYVGGEFGVEDGPYGLARWNGSSWSLVGAPGNVGTLLSREVLYIGHVEDPIVWRYDGTEVVEEATGTGFFYALTWWQDQLVVAGDFDNLDGIDEADHIATWDGAAWHALGSDGDGDGALKWCAAAVTVWQGDIVVGGCNDLLLGDDPASRSIARFDGTSWSPFHPRTATKSAFNNEVRAFLPDGDSLLVGGFFTDGGGVATADKLARLTLVTDPTPPTATLALNHGAISTTDRSVNATIDAVDADSGLASYRIRAAGGTWSAWEDWPDVATASRRRQRAVGPATDAPSVSVPWQLPADPGPHAVEAQVRDGAGNVSLVAGAAIELDPSVASEFVAVSIASGAEYTDSREVVLDLFAPPGIARIKVANDSGGLAAAPWEPYVAHRAWTLGNPNGEIVTKNVYVRFSSGPGDTGETASDDIVIDPLAPGSGPAAAKAAAAAPDVADPAAVSTVTLDTRARDQAGGSGVTAMQLSTSSSFAGAVWEPSAASRQVPVESRAATTVHWRFRDAAGNVSPAVTRTVADAAAPSVPTQVAPFHGTTATSRRPTLRWLQEAGSGLYRVQVDQTATFASPLVDATTSSTRLRPSSALPAGADLVWRIRRGTGPWSPAWAFRVPAAEAPVLVAPAADATIAGLSPRLSWKAVQGADRYAVQISADPAFLVGVTTGQTAATRLDLPSLARRAKLHWRVRARVGGDWGAWAEPRSFRTPAVGVPSLVAPAAGAGVDPPATLDWTDVPGAATYRIQVCATSACAATERDASVDTSAYRLGGSLAPGSHWWRVRAVAADGGKGAWSRPRAFTR